MTQYAMLETLHNLHLQFALPFFQSIWQTAFRTHHQAAVIVLTSILSYTRHPKKSGIIFTLILLLLL
jgi:hypothetical protein